MVMADDPAVRANRLALLAGVAATMNRVADISQAGAPERARPLEFAPWSSSPPKPSRRRVRRKLIVLDRDGVINHDSDQFIKSPDEWRPIPGSLEAIARLNHAGYRVVVATNQSGVGRGLFDMATLNAIHEKMHRALAQVGGRIDAIFFCPHTADAQCECRKPQARDAAARSASASTWTWPACPASATALRDLQAADARRRPADAGADRQGREDAARRHVPEEHRDLPRPRVRRVGAARRRMSRRRPGSTLHARACAPSLFALFQLVVTPLYAVAMLALVLAPAGAALPRIARLVPRQPVGGARDLRHPLARRRPREHPGDARTS